MTRMRILPFLAVLLLAAPAFAQDAPDFKDTPAGTYQLDPSHASITFKINHLGFSRYTGRFDKMAGTLAFDPAQPEKSALDITIDVNSVDTNNAKLEEELKGDKWFNGIKFPAIAFHTTKVERTGPATGKITGDLTMMGVTRPVTFDTVLIGAGKHPMNGKGVLGFSATTSIMRSDFGFQNGLPFVGDKVDIQAEAEFDQAQ